MTDLAQHTDHLAAYLAQLAPIDTCEHLGLQAVRLRRQAADSGGARVIVASEAHEPVMAPLAVALASGAARITEVGSGRVDRLRIHNLGDRLLFGMSGELIMGGRQDRVLNSSVLIAPGQSSNVSVSCVEQHRWDPAGACRGFRGVSDSANSSVRRSLRQSVVTSLHHTGADRSDQHKVWQKVTQTLQCTGVHQAGGTGTLAGGLERQRGRYDVYVEACRPLANQVGLALFAPGSPGAGLHGFSSIDCFMAPELLVHYATRLVRGAAVDAVDQALPRARVGADGRERPVSPFVKPYQVVRQLLGRMSQLKPLVSRPAAGDAPGAREHSYLFDGYVASVLTLMGRPVHLAITPADDASELESESESEGGGFGNVGNRRLYYTQMSDVTSFPGPSPTSNAGQRRPDAHGPIAAVFRIQFPGAEPRHFTFVCGTYVFGRTDDCQLRVTDEAVSRRHAKLEVREDRVTIRDLGSTNGTHVNGEPVLYARLEPGDTVLLGRHTQITVVNTLGGG